MKIEDQYQIMKEALERIANLPGNPYNSENSLIIAREAKFISNNALRSIMTNETNEDCNHRWELIDEELQLYKCNICDKEEIDEEEIAAI